MKRIDNRHPGLLEASSVPRGGSKGPLAGAYPDVSLAPELRLLIRQQNLQLFMEWVQKYGSWRDFLRAHTA